MTLFESKVNINKPVSNVYQFLADFNNHQQLMPDSIQDWHSTYDEASFGIQNMAKLSLRITERVENTSIKITPSQKAPFEVDLKWILSPDDDETIVTYIISAELNMMMRMMASGPLQKLVDHEVQTLAGLLS